MPRPLSAAPAVIGSRPPARAGPATTLDGPAPNGPPPARRPAARGGAAPATTWEAPPPTGPPPGDMRGGPGPGGPPGGDARGGRGPPSFPPGFSPAGPALEGPMSPANAGTARPTNR